MKILLAAVGAFLLGTAGCATETACAAYAGYGVVITLDPVPPHAVVTFTVDGGASQTKECSGSDCYALSIGLETAGHYVMHVAADGYQAQDAEAQVAKDKDGCHVVIQTVALHLVAAPAT